MGMNVIYDSGDQLVAILKHIDPNDCLGNLAIVQQCVSIWYKNLDLMVMTH
jgi:hypothetical protein